MEQFFSQLLNTTRFISGSIMSSKNYPKVSFIIPLLNEGGTIKQALDSIESLDYPLEQIEIILAKGPSKDDTNKIIEDYAKNFKNIVIIDNPTGNTAIGRNLCIKHSSGDMLMNYSGHVTAEKNLLKILALRLAESPKEIVSVGCSNVSPQKQNLVGETASVVFSSFLGGKNLFVQNAEFDEERYSDHVSFACYRKKPVVDVGSFDPDFWCGQDAELDLRLLKKGYKILYTPKTKVYHFKRSTIKSLFKQMYRYGIARVNMIKKHPDTLKIFHLFGAGFILGIIAILILTLLSIVPVWFPFFLAVAYLLASFASSLRVSKKPVVVAVSPLFYFLVHAGYGIGFLRGSIYGKL